jgi:hypothetical protein
MRPVLLAATTTILGLIPLLPDVFFVNMAITMMAGLGFATILTLVIVPALYAILFRVRVPRGGGGWGVMDGGREGTSTCRGLGPFCLWT